MKIFFILILIFIIRTKIFHYLILITQFNLIIQIKPSIWEICEKHQIKFNF